MFLITTLRHEKPLPALPQTPRRLRRPSALVEVDNSSIYSYASSSYSGTRHTYPVRDRHDSQTSSCPSERSLVPSILKSRSSESRHSRRHSQRKSVRFLPIIDTLLRHTHHSRSISHDLRFPPHSARMLSTANYHGSGRLNPAQYIPFCTRTRAQPAVSPPVSQIWVVSYDFPWAIEVNATVSDAGAHRFAASGRDKYAPEPFVTVYDVLHALWAHLQRPMMEEEWSALTSSQRRAIRRTCLSAYAHEPSRSSQSESPSLSKSRSYRSSKAAASDNKKLVRKIDWLGTSTRFAGLGKDESLIAERVEEPWRRELTWVLVLDENEYRYDDAAY
ncbi:unnamed protein product [Rhizoctonia solani]|uniref:DUF6699 domain-containing protein n=2 Tax=Rhizoctonia solani TaxID=456999 RepID=A0A8H3CRM4_9AGAM|nr:cadmium ion transporter, putative [Rhizoctonia solani AG-3 Rhs1AP]CAE6493723.1 unnamed protein product [Rhizoctonia solani]CAE6513586.1 unnamed protein product [Rhizoctonia solani]